MRTIGIEEEMLLVDGESGRPLAVAGRVLQGAAQRGAEVGDDGVEHAREEPGGTLEAELQQQQLETDTEPRASLTDLDQDLRTWRDRAITAARGAGARVVASGTAATQVVPRPFSTRRYAQMVTRFGLTAQEQLTCGCHVHVCVESDEEGVGVLDRIRVWLPTLLAISANSPFWQGKDSGYASFRSQAWMRWPSAGPTDVFGSAVAYHRLVDQMVDSGVLLDPAMAYFDARLSATYPTVEIRVADVCMDARDTVLVAGLCRALVETAAGEWAEGRPPAQVPTSMLRLATWQAGHDGVDGDLLDPLTGRPYPAADVLAGLVDHVRPALRSAGDEALVEERLADVLKRGNGARRQRAVLERTGSLVDVVADAARVTAGQDC